MADQAYFKLNQNLDNENLQYFPLVKNVQLSLNIIVLDIDWVKNSRYSKKEDFQSSSITENNNSLNKFKNKSSPIFILKATIFNRGIQTRNINIQVIKGNQRKWSLGFIYWNPNEDFEKMIEINRNFILKDDATNNYLFSHKNDNYKNNNFSGAVYNQRRSSHNYRRHNNHSPKEPSFHIEIECFLYYENKEKNRFQIERNKNRNNERNNEEFDYNLIYESVRYPYGLLEENNELFKTAAKAIESSLEFSPLFSISFYFPLLYKIPRNSFIEASYMLGNRCLQFCLLPDAPISDWISQIFLTDFLWCPRFSTIWEDENDDVPNCFYPRVLFQTNQTNQKTTSSSSSSSSCFCCCCPNVTNQQNNKIQRLGGFYWEKAEAINDAVPDTEIKQKSYKVPWKTRKQRVSPFLINYTAKILCLGRK